MDAPCGFNGLVSYYFGDSIKCHILTDKKAPSLSNELLLDLYLSGEIRFELNIYYPITNAYYRITYFMDEDERSGHITAFVVGRLIKQQENEIFTASGEIKDKLCAETETFYKKMMDTQSCGVFAYTVPGYQIVTANAEARRMFGYDTVDNLQKHVADVIKNIYYPSPDTLDELKKLRTEDGTVDYECIFNKCTEKEFNVKAKTKCFYSHTGQRIA